MTKISVLQPDGTPGPEMELPPLFQVPVRADLIRRSIEAARANRRQPYGPTKESGTATSAESWGVDRGMARTPRDERGRGRHAPNTVGGRMAHAPEVEKIWTRKVNRRERRAALQGALAATASVETARARGHRFDARLPLVADDALEALDKVAEVRKFLEAAGLWPDVERASVRKIRAGKGKMRGRKMKKRRSVLFVVSNAEALRGARNLPGVEVVTVDGVRTEILAPGGHPGRLTVYTRSALGKVVERYGARPPTQPRSQTETRGSGAEQRTPTQPRSASEHEGRGPRGGPAGAGGSS